MIEGKSIGRGETKRFLQVPLQVCVYPEMSRRVIFSARRIPICAPETSCLGSRGTSGCSHGRIWVTLLSGILLFDQSAPNALNALAAEVKVMDVRLVWLT